MREAYNPEPPRIMHIDLNSCFATVEQQSRPLLRGKPVAIVNRATDQTAIVTASYEAKALGVTVGMKYREAVKLAPALVAIESDPPKYRYVYRKLLAILGEYSTHVRMKSIDEGVIDFHYTTAALQQRSLEDIGREIKQRLRDEVGEYMSCNVGIATNRFLAKTAAGLHKPDGLDVITADTLRETLGRLTLRDLTGIAYRNERRLNRVGIMTPLEFLDASPSALRDMVFGGVVGEWWHQRLRGWEVDDVDYEMRRVGRQYVLEQRGLPQQAIIERLHHLCESVGERLRLQHKAARGIYVYAKLHNRQYWHASHLSPLPFMTDKAIYMQALQLFQPPEGDVREIGIHVYHLEEPVGGQVSLFAEELLSEEAVQSAVDTINGRFGSRTIHAAHTLGTGIYMRQKIPFGSTRHL